MRSLADRVLSAHPPQGLPVEPHHTDPCGLLFAQIERRLGSERWALLKVRKGDYEIRSRSGVAGRGDTPADALADFLSQTGDV